MNNIFKISVAVVAMWIILGIPAVIIFGWFTGWGIAGKFAFFIIGTTFTIINLCENS